MKQQPVAVFASLALVVALVSGCASGAAAPTVTTEPPSSTEVPIAETVAPVDAERGTRENPLAVGEYRKIAAESMWTVGAEGATVVNEGYVVVPLRLGMDWEFARARAEAAGGSVEGGLDPWQALQVEFVTADGRSYTTMDNYDVDVPNALYNVGTVYPPAEYVSASVAVSVPAGEVPGGVWVIRNSNGDVVFIASQ